MIDWDDFRYFLSAARCGSFGAAAARLNTSATTVGRRVQRLETAMRATLFTRSAAGLQLTPVGARLADAGGKIESAVETAQLVQENASTGSVRISASEGFGTIILAPALYQLTKAHPHLSIELAAWAGSPSASRREVDMAVMFSPATSNRLSVEHLSDFEVGLYGSAPFIDRYGTPGEVNDLRRLPLVGFIDDMLYAPELRYTDDLAPNLQLRLTSTSSRAHMEIIASGAGIGMVPCFMAAHDPRLVRLMPEIACSRRSFWLATHDEIRDTARQRAVRSWLFDTVMDKQAVMLPSLPKRPPGLGSR